MEATKQLGKCEKEKNCHDEGRDQSEEYKKRVKSKLRNTDSNKIHTTLIVENHLLGWKPHRVEISNIYKYT